MNLTPALPHFADASWQPDILGSDFQQLYFDLGEDPDGEGEVGTTVVRYRPAQSDTTKPAVIYVPGMTDYFFHSHLAQHLHEDGYAVYGVDLRKCGRAHQPGQTWHFTTNLEHYYPDLETVATFLSDHHDSFVILGHSTGGLIATMWLDHLKTSNPELHDRFRGMILNSPFVDMIVPGWITRALTPFVNVVGKRYPHRIMKGGNLGTYGAALHTSAHGEWDYDTTLKPLEGHPKHLGWVRACVLAQREIHQSRINVERPTLVLSSDHSVLHRPYSARSHTADTVLNVKQIKQWSPFVSTTVTLIQIPDAMHDVFLSRSTPRREALERCTQWLDHWCVD